MAVKKRKKQDIDIDDLIEERVATILSEKWAEIIDETTVVTGTDDPLLPILKVLCSNCIYWEVSAIQEDNTRVNGVCHENPILPQRKATDWCSKGIKA